MAQTYFATTQPGLEDALLSELRQLKIKKPKVLTGGVEFQATYATLYEANLTLRSATRIWLRLDEFRARDTSELYRKCRRFDWERLLGPDLTLDIRAHSQQSRMVHTGTIAEVVAQAIGEHFTDDLRRPAPTFGDRDDAQRIMVRIEGDRCQLSLDTSGARLQQRGWRTESGPAPLRENIAAGMLLLSGWTPDQPLLDPMCGSGTILIEAALIATKTAPNLARNFAFERWQNFEPRKLRGLRANLKSTQMTDAAPTLLGFDQDPQVLDAAAANARRAGVNAHLHLTPAPLSDLCAPDTPPGFLITNPPYGERLESGDVLPTMIERWQSQLPAWSLAFIWPRKRAAEVQNCAEGRLQNVATIFNGGISVDLWRSAPLR
ncbi:RNA methyltransferase [Lujinxingia vulgaris]|uniref:RNA methyltransferase n=1 Tax=Lujinxingia vulgaris TaxID=2600176 RepID=A0A5C6XHJ8_9DELT|nr:RNA methyltransferase [Lujinxingia vulgaris]TXD43760.1 RNA methyltransferase [Lujinxingia vulgaris]